jgi:predicted MFS family arabinose efflux permease
MGLFAFSALLVTIIPQFHFTHSDVGGGRLTMRQVRRDFSEGWMTLARDGTAYLSLILSVVAATSILVMATLLPKYATHVLGIRPENLVFILAPAVVGIFVGIRTVDWLAGRFNGLATISGAYLLMAASLVALGLVPATARFVTDLNPFGLFDPGPLTDRAARIAATIVYANCYGFALTVVVTMGRAILNHRIPLQMQGRVFAAQNVLSNLIAILPVIVAGLLADAVGVGPVLVVAGCAALAAALWSRLETSRVVPART